MTAPALPLPPLVPGHWLTGSFAGIRAAPYAFIAEAAERHGGIARFRVFHKTSVAISDVDLIDEVLVRSAPRFPKGSLYRNLELLIGPGLVTHADETWQQHRRIIQPGFHRKAIAGLVTVINGAMAQRFAAAPGAAGDGRPFDVIREVRAITQQVISEVLLGTPVDALRGARFTENFYAGQRFVAQKNWSLVPWPAWVPTAANRGLRRIHDDLRAFLSERVEARLAAGVGQTGDMLDLLLLAHGADGGAVFSRDDVLGEMSTLFSAGYDTTSAALAWTLWFLATHPAVQDRLHGELQTVLAGRAPGWDDIERLVYTEQVLNEAMRLHPPIHSLSRTNPASVTLGGYTIPAGTNLMLSIYGVHRSPRYWPEPEKFDPDRFAPDAAARRHPKAFMPFSVGKRRCIGAGFAMAEAVLVLANLVRRFRFRLAVAGQTVKPVVGPTNYPEPFQLALDPRPASAA